jgi:hypothetical protein
MDYILAAFTPTNATFPGEVGGGQDLCQWLA